MKAARFTGPLLGLMFIVSACGSATTQDGHQESPTRRPDPTEASANPTQVSGISEAPPPRGAEREFSTDFSRHSIDYSEVISGGPSKDVIPAIDEPRLVTVEEADQWLNPVEPVILFRLGEDARAYPIQILMWHEIVNDVVNDTPVLVTFCPLCNTAIAFDRTVDGRMLDFGTTGRLRYSNLIMYDRQTETWWQQATGEAIAGEMTGSQLEFLPASIVSWEDFRASHPDGSVLSRDTGYVRDYGRNPYSGYDNINRSPFLYDGPITPDQLPPMARVLAVEIGDEIVAYPYQALESEQVVNDNVGGEEIVVLWQPGTASALDTPSLAQGRDVGSAIAFSRQVDGRSLTFEARPEGITDRETGTLWNFLGEAVEGPLEGQHLREVVAINHFWFSWSVFRPGTRVYSP